MLWDLLAIVDIRFYSLGTPSKEDMLPSSSSVTESHLTWSLYFLGHPATEWGERSCPPPVNQCRAPLSTLILEFSSVHTKASSGLHWLLPLPSPALSLSFPSVGPQKHTPSSVSATPSRSPHPWHCFLKCLYHGGQSWFTSQFFLWIEVIDFGSDR